MLPWILGAIVVAIVVFAVVKGNREDKKCCVVKASDFPVKKATVPVSPVVVKKVVKKTTKKTK